MKLRRGWPMLLLVVLLVAIPTFEIWVLVQVGQAIGLVATLLILFAEALIGAWLMRREGSRAWQALTAAFSTGRVPHGELADAALVLVGGVLLMLPGFLTDIVGLLFLMPLTRPVARKVVAFFVARRINKMAGPLAARAPGSVVIRGETVDQPGDGPGVISGEILDGPSR